MTARSSGSPFVSQPHRRYNPLCDEWLLVSAERTGRPWLGGEETPPARNLPAYDPGCYLCPGNTRANGEHNPAYDSTFVFTNDFAALRPDSPKAIMEVGLLKAQTERGTCRVICFTPRHDLTVAQMSVTEVRGIVDLWAAVSDALGTRFEWVQVFENRGTAMGASNRHPHGQIWAGNALPVEGTKEDRTQRQHFETTGRKLLLDYAAQESGGPRELVSDDEWLIVVPFWAAWPFETLVIPRRPVARLPELDERQRDSLSARMIELVRGYDGLFDMPFPYSMGWHQAPFQPGYQFHWQLHAHFYPPLLQATMRKFMVGYELLSEPQRDITAEAAAERLRASILGSSSTSRRSGG